MLQAAGTGHSNSMHDCLLKINLVQPFNSISILIQFFSHRKSTFKVVLSYKNINQQLTCLETLYNGTCISVLSELYSDRTKSEIKCPMHKNIYTVVTKTMKLNTFQLQEHLYKIQRSFSHVILPTSAT